MSIKLLVVAIAMAAMTVTGCSSSSKSSSGSSDTTTTTAAPNKQPVCAARTHLEQSVRGLASPALLTSGKAGVQSALDTVKTNLDAVSSSAQDVYKPQVDAVRSAIDDVETELSNMGNGNASANLQAVGTAIAKVGTTSATLSSTLKTACPSG